MDKEKKQLTLVERWDLDNKSYEKGAHVKTSTPQCKKCKYLIKADALHCKIYKDEKKPKDVIFCHKECLYFISNDVLEFGIINEDDQNIYGGIFGFCIGDILGVPVEFSTRDERDLDKVNELRAYGTYHQPFGTWSDDTSMMLCLIDTIINGYSLKELKCNFIKYYKEAAFTPNGYVFDIGISTEKAINKMIMGIKHIQCGGDSETDNGNGSLMRILPIAYLAPKLNSDKLIKLVEDVSALTHAHSRAKLACIIYVEFASQLILGKEKHEAFSNTIEFIDRHCKENYYDEFNSFENILNKKIVNFNRTQIKSTGYVIDTLEAVFWLFYNTDSYKQMVLNAVNLGGDTDTIAALVGGLAGIYYGFNAIPDRWIQNIERKHEIKKMTDMFSEVIKK